MSRRSVVGIAVAGALVLLLAGYIGSRAVRGWALPAGKAPASTSIDSGHTISVTIDKGENARSIGAKLQHAGVIRSGTWFGTLAALDGIQNDLAAGSYVFQRNQDAQGVLDRIKVGILEPQSLVTIPEGLRTEQVADLLQKTGVLPADDFLNAVKDGTIQDPLLQDRPQGMGLEGYVFPDTYYFPKKTAPDAVIKEMLAAFDNRFDQNLRSAVQAQGLTVYQAVTLASLVEREAQVPSERPIIASVFLNRLKQDMPLQADPTVQYALAQDPASVSANGWWKRDLTVDDLKVDSPYNTYKVRGLPPGPICNPGRDSLAAVANPAQTNFLYFVAKGDGSHAFAGTLAEHNGNIQKYQKR